MPAVTHLFHYPLKSSKGQLVETASINRYGLPYDRQWAVIERSSGRALTVREFPKLMHIQAKVQDASLILDIPGYDAVTYQSGSRKNSDLQLRMFSDILYGTQVYDEAEDKAISDYLGTKCSVVNISKHNVRTVKERYGGNSDTPLSFADAAPVLLINLASLEELNARLTKSVKLEQFRPNIVIDHTPPYEEEKWKGIRINNLDFTVGSVCNRCKVITIDPDTLETDPDGQPLKVLSTYKSNANGINFGMYLIPSSTGIINIGDKIVLS